MAVDASAEVHPAAVIDAGAVVGAGCRIGPYCVVGADSVLGRGVVLHSHVVVAGRTRLGDETSVFPFASIGHPPQSFGYKGEPTELVVGARTTIREQVTLSPGTVGGGGVTRIGDDCYLMIQAHVGHDCTLGNKVTLTNGATLAGHVTVGDGAILGGLAAVHQHVRIGRGAMIGGLAGVAADVIPYGMVAGERGRLIGLNLVGLKRRGAERAHIHAMRAAFAEIFGGEGTLLERAEAASGRHPDNPLVEEVVGFITAGSARSFTLPPARHDD